MISRRNFISQSALGATALAVTPSVAAAIHNRTENKPLKNNTSMQLAAISWCFGTDDLDELFKTVKNTGYTALQFCGDHKTYKPENVIDTAKKYDISIASYDPSTAKPDDDTHATLSNAIACFKEVIDYAAAINAPMVTLQSLGFWTVNTKTYKEALQFVADACKTLCSYARQKGLLTTYEACCHYEIPVVQDIADLLWLHKAVGSDNLLLVLDSFHMNITESDMVKPIYDAGNLLYSYHVSDSGRGGIGTGHIDFLKQYRTLKDAGFKGLVCFEFSTKHNRPYKLPMNEADKNEFLSQNKNSLAIWKSFMEQY